MTRARARMGELGVDVLLLSVGPDLPYLTGYEAMPLERLTMLVLPRDGDASLVVPQLERSHKLAQRYYRSHWCCWCLHHTGRCSRAIARLPPDSHLAALLALNYCPALLPAVVTDGVPQGQ